MRHFNEYIPLFFAFHDDQRCRWRWPGGIAWPRPGAWRNNFPAGYFQSQRQVAHRAASQSQVGMGAR